ncbi:MAG: ethanolamine ammonia lyase-activating protein, partial [Dehalococcoidia bacterium]|nr:ethanolamine ammonia lyase-activating protein [Dehalococcoidia bacterium]
NFIADVAAFKLQDMLKRGAGGTSINFELANNTMCAHVSEFPLGTYKKAHRHAAGAHIVLLSGEGYSILWKEGQPKVRVDWHTGSLFVPPDMWFHQHFNVGRDPARYLAVRWGSKKHRVSGVLSMAGVEDSLKSGGNQIEYEDEDPEIRKMFEAELAKRGLEPRMGPFFEKK